MRIDAPTTTAWVLTADNTVIGAYGPGVTRRTVSAILAASGLQPVPWTQWEYSIPPDGWERPVQSHGGCACQRPETVTDPATGVTAAPGAPAVAGNETPAGPPPHVTIEPRRPRGISC